MPSPNNYILAKGKKRSFVLSFMKAILLLGSLLINAVRIFGKFSLMVMWLLKGINSASKPYISCTVSLKLGVICL